MKILILIFAIFISVGAVFQASIAHDEKGNTGVLVGDYVAENGFPQFLCKSFKYVKEEGELTINGVIENHSRWILEEKPILMVYPRNRYLIHSMYVDLRTNADLLNDIGWHYFPGEVSILIVSVDSRGIINNQEEIIFSAYKMSRYGNKKESGQVSMIFQFLVTAHK